MIRGYIGFLVRYLERLCFCGRGLMGLVFGVFWVSGLRVRPVCGCWISYARGSWWIRRCLGSELGVWLLKGLEFGSPPSQTFFLIIPK